jgi:hypothetical protein
VENIYIICFLKINFKINSLSRFLAGYPVLRPGFYKIKIKIKIGELKNESKLFNWDKVEK